MEKATYKQISQVKINDNKYMVISECSKGGFTLGQKVIVKDAENTIEMFLKGAIHINSIDTLGEIRDAIDEIIAKN